MNKIKKGSVSREVFNVLLHDLGCLELKNTEDNKYHYKLLKGNLMDLFGINEVEEFKEEYCGACDNSHCCKDLDGDFIDENVKLCMENNGR